MLKRAHAFGPALSSGVRLKEAGEVIASVVSPAALLCNNNSYYSRTPRVHATAVSAIGINMGTTLSSLVHHHCDHAQIVSSCSNYLLIVHSAAAAACLCSGSLLCQHLLRGEARPRSVAAC